MIKKQIWLYEQEYRGMTPKIAKEYFAWFIENIPNEMDILQQKVGDSILLDYTPESLIPLYDWYLPQRKYVKLSKRQIRKDCAGAPDYILEESLESRYAPTIGSTELGARLGIYLGEVFVRNDPDLYWDYTKKPKSDVSFNVPAICGFSPPTAKHPTYVDVVNGSTPIYSSTPRGEKEKNTFHEWYQLWTMNKAIYYDPNFCAAKYAEDFIKYEEEFMKSYQANGGIGSPK